MLDEVGANNGSNLRLKNHDDEIADEANEKELMNN